MVHWGSYFGESGGEREKMGGEVNHQRRVESPLGESHPVIHNWMISLSDFPKKQQPQQVVGIPLEAMMGRRRRRRWPMNFLANNVDRLPANQQDTSIRGWAQFLEREMRNEEEEKGRENTLSGLVDDIPFQFLYLPYRSGWSTPSTKGKQATHFFACSVHPHRFFSRFCFLCKEIIRRSFFP